jgi:hypothetical protein
LVMVKEVVGMVGEVVVVKEEVMEGEVTVMERGVNEEVVKEMVGLCIN